MLTRFQSLRNNVSNKSIRAIITTFLILLVVLVLAAAPQVAVWACGSVIGTCPCPGC